MKGMNTMKYEIKNQYLRVMADDRGAELSSIQSADGTEYLWQADPKIWNGQAPNIFPYVARLTNETYTLDGQEYHMKIHGLVRYQTLVAEEVQEDRITFRLDANEETRAQYPFAFTYRITYALDGNRLVTTTSVENKDSRRMAFAVGGHPGFNVPMEEGLTFEDYELEFSAPAHPYRVGFTDRCFLNGQDVLYPLADERKIPLRHDLFDHDAVVLKHADRTVTIRSEKGSRSVTVSYPDFMYIGFWHMPKKEAPYVCVEPWSSLPSRDGITEDFAQQADLIRVDAGKTWETTWTIEIR
jgi:galactose mutarotase-like enzyme